MTRQSGWAQCAVWHVSCLLHYKTGYHYNGVHAQSICLILYLGCHLILSLAWLQTSVKYTSTLSLASFWWSFCVSFVPLSVACFLAELFSLLSYVLLYFPVLCAVLTCNRYPVYYLLLQWLSTGNLYCDTLSYNDM